MYGVTSPDGILVAVTATEAEANDAVINHVLKVKGEGVEGYIDPLLSFVDPVHLISEQERELKRIRAGAAEYYGYKIEAL